MSVIESMRDMLKAGLRIVGIIAIVVLIGLGIALVLGYASLSLKQPGQMAQSRTAVCNSADIQEYNKFVTTFTMVGEQQEQKAANMQAQVDKLKKKNGFTDDPSCLFIEYSAAIVGSNAQVAEEKFSAIEALSKKGIYPSNELLDLTSLGSMRDRIEALKNAGKENTESRGSG